MSPYGRPRLSRPASVRKHSLIRARDLVITDGNFTQNIIHRRRSSKGMNDLYKSLRVESSLFYDAQVHLEGGFIPEIPCDPQAQALKVKVGEWIREQGLRTIWIYGPPSSTAKIAQQVADALNTGDLLLGTVFFPLSKREQHAIHRIVPTIAYQIALAIPETRAFIASAIDEDPSVLERSLDLQIQQLIQGPLMRAFHAIHEGESAQWASKVLVVHGLANNDVGRNVWRCISRLAQGPLRFRIVISAAAGFREGDISVGPSTSVYLGSEFGLGNGRGYKALPPIAFVLFVLNFAGGTASAGL